MDPELEEALEEALDACPYHDPTHFGYEGCLSCRKSSRLSDVIWEESGSKLWYTGKIGGCVQMLCWLGVKPNRKGRNTG